MARERWVALAALTIARVAMGVQFQSVGAVSPLLMERLGIANAEIGLLVGLFSLPGVVLALPGGMLGQRFGARRVVVVAMLLMTVGSVVVGVATTFPAAVVGRLLTATGAVLLNVLGTAMVAGWFSDREIVWAMAIFLNAWPVGNGLALLTLPTVASLWAVPAAFHAAAGVSAIGAAAMALLYPPSTTDGVPREPAASTRLSRRETGLVTLAAMPWMFYNVGYAVMLGFVPAFLVRGGLSVEHAGALLGVALALFVASVQAGGAAAQWSGRPGVVVALGLLPFGVALSALRHASPAPTLVAVGLLAGLPAAALAAAPARVLRPETRAPGLGLFYTWYYVGMALLPGVAGWRQDALGGAAAIDCAAAAIFLALASYLAFQVATARGRARETPEGAPVLVPSREDDLRSRA